MKQTGRKFCRACGCNHDLNAFLKTIDGKTVELASCVWSIAEANRKEHAARKRMKRSGTYKMKRSGRP